MNLFQCENNIRESTFVELKNPRDALVFRKNCHIRLFEQIIFLEKDLQKETDQEGKSFKMESWAFYTDDEE